MIKLPDWFYIWLRKQSKSFDGDLLIKIRKGELVAFTRSDFWTEKIFQERYQEESSPEGDRYVGAVTGPSTGRSAADGWNAADGRSYTPDK